MFPAAKFAVGEGLGMNPMPRLWPAGRIRSVVASSISGEKRETILCKVGILEGNVLMDLRSGLIQG